MKFSENWLREWVNPDVSTEELSEQLTMAGLEVDAVEPAAPAFEGVVVGEIVSAEPHPDADKLRVCQVNVGGDEPLNIVCGAPNARVGLRVPTAVVGAKLPGDFKIKKAKLRGVPSFGMLSSAKELGLSEAAEGLMELPADAPVGQGLREYLQLEDVSIELGLTPNRSDCLSIEGVAREVGVLNRCEVKGPEINPVEPGSETTFGVAVNAKSDCPRYVGRVIQGIEPQAETPVWMQEKLRRSGIRSLGPVVDVTNYVLLELGQPMHAFDLARLSGGIDVRRAREGEKLTLLNGDEVELDGQTLVIADGNGPVALAGIMGGADSAVGEGTADIFLESAFFAPEAMAGRARRYGLHTDSSHRFERGVSPELQRRALERATRLLLDIVGGTPGPVVEVAAENELPVRNPVRLRAARITRVLGIEMPAGEVADILQRLGMAVEAGEREWSVTPPAYRFDIEREVDLIEEVGRVYGYNRLPTSRPVGALSMTPAPEGQVPLRRLRSILVERGYQEAITYSFVDPKLQKLLDPDHEAVELANPISSEMAVMRTSLWPGLVQALRHNLHRQRNRVRLFETGLRFVPNEGDLAQEKVIGGLVHGPLLSEQWGADGGKVDFFDAKGDVEALLATLGRVEVSFEAAEHPALHPGQSARIRVGGEVVGWLGALHPSLERKLELGGHTFVYELMLAPFKAATVPKFEELSKFPAIRRDLAVLVDRDVNAGRVLDCIRDAAPETLRDLELFDVYTGEGVDSGRKSLALGLTLQAHSRTLKDSEIEKAVADIVTALQKNLGATLRE
jgi:phenylalanyl-tRNA synthetase beta chain